MSNRGYGSSAVGAGGAGYGSPNYYMRPNINENRPEYYDRNNNAGSGVFNTGYRGGYGGNSYSDERIFRPWDQTNRYVVWHQQYRKLTILLSANLKCWHYGKLMWKESIRDSVILRTDSRQNTILHYTLAYCIHTSSISQWVRNRERTYFD